MEFACSLGSLSRRKRPSDCLAKKKRERRNNFQGKCKDGKDRVARIEKRDGLYKIDKQMEQIEQREKLEQIEEKEQIEQWKGQKDKDFRRFSDIEIEKQRNREIEK